MTVTLRATVTGDERWRRTLRDLTPAQNRRIMRDSLLECAFLIQENAADKQILGGGVGLRRGPRGGAQQFKLKPHPTKLTSRTGTLRRSISVNRQPLPMAVEVGTALVYGKIHELGLGRYPKRAFLEPAVKAVGPRFPEIFARNWRKAAGV